MADTTDPEIYRDQTVLRGLRLADEYRTGDEMRNAIANFGSWFAVVSKGQSSVLRGMGDEGYDLNVRTAKLDSSHAAMGSRIRRASVSLCRCTGSGHE